MHDDLKRWRALFEADDAVARFHADALPVYHDRLSKPGQTLHRIGNDYEYSEFTHDPSGRGGPPRMSGGRGSGFASGMYAYQKAGHSKAQGSTQPVAGPVNPLIISRHSKSGRGYHTPGLFQRDAINMMRAAEQIANGEVDLSKLSSLELLLHKQAADYVERAENIKVYAGERFWTTMWHLAEYRPKGVGWQQAMRDVVDAIIAWGQHRHVHPVNILLSRWGYDGIMWAGDAEQYGNTGDYGAVAFPPITHEGELVGVVPEDGTYMHLHPELRTSAHHAVP
jgi:hypothetical protein